MKRPTLFVEPFAGAAAVSLRLVGGRRCQPVVSWMGGKRRYAQHILGAMGLRSGLGCDRLLLADAGTWGWVWPVLLAPQTRDLVVAKIRSWSNENPVELWNRLRDTPPMENVAERAAQWLWLQARAGSGVPVWWADGGVVASDGRGVPRPAGQESVGDWVASDKTGAIRPSNLFQNKAPTLVQSERDRADGSRRCKLPGQKGAGSPKGTGGRVDIAAMADEIEALAQAVAAWACLQSGGALGKEVSVADDGTWSTHGYAHLAESGRARGFTDRLMVGPLADRIEALATPLPPLAVYHGSAMDLVPNGDHTSTWVYLDPPYEGCTSYERDCARPNVLELARMWSAAGATVALSERVPLDGALGGGWEAQELTALGRSNSKPEFLTINRQTTVRVAVQQVLPMGAA